MLTIGTRPPSGMKLSCMALTAPHEASGGDRREQRETGDAEADLLALHVAARLRAVAAWSMHGGCSAGLPDCSASGHGDAGDER